MSVLDSELFQVEIFDGRERDGDQQATGMHCELITYDSRVNEQGQRIAFVVHKDKEQPFGSKEGGHDGSDPAMVRTNFYDIHGVFKYSTLVIRSSVMRDALRKCIGRYPDVNLETKTITVVDSPHFIFHYLKELNDHGRTLQDPIASRHLAFMLRYMQHCFRDGIESHRAMRQNSEKTAALTYDDVWMVFRPGILVHHLASDGSPMLSRLVKMKRCECADPSCRDHTWKLIIENIEFTGAHYEWCRTKLFLKSYTGLREICQLGVYPLEFHANHQELLQTMIGHGKKYLGLADVHQKQYDGVVWAGKSAIKHSRYMQRVRGRIIIDMKGFLKTVPARKTYNDLDGEDSDDDDACDLSYNISSDTAIPADDNDQPVLSDTDLAVCVQKIPGFCLTTKNWYFFHVAHIQDVEFNKEAFSNLILPARSKGVLRALADPFKDSGAVQFDDVIKGKGQGLVVLLYGPAGVGKTLTAESIADLTKRPLYTITSGSLGVTANEVEQNLSAALRQAKLWRAIVLIDEADVFLARRTQGNVHRNALISVFLRQLEYFEGILFLTTNRVSSIDEAFFSRIHVTVRYHELTVTTRQELWKTFILRAHQRAVEDWLSPEVATTLASHKLNGRQIKNCVRAASAIAGADGRPLVLEHIETAIDAVIPPADKILTSRSADEQASDSDYCDTQRPLRKRARITE